MLMPVLSQGTSPQSAVSSVHSPFQARIRSSCALMGKPGAAPFELRQDPRHTATPEDLAAQFALLLHIRDKLSVTHDAINQMRSVRQQVEEWLRRTEKQP